MINELKKVGKFLHLSNLTNNILIIRLNEPLRIGTVIYDKKMREIGPIIELFGPVEKPYARIKIKGNINLIENILGQDCFVIVGDERPIKWRKMPRKATRNI